MSSTTGIPMYTFWIPCATLLLIYLHWYLHMQPNQVKHSLINLRYYNHLCCKSNNQYYHLVFLKATTIWIYTCWWSKMNMWNTKSWLFPSPFFSYRLVKNTANHRCSGTSSQVTILSTLAALSPKHLAMTNMQAGGERSTLKWLQLHVYFHGPKPRNSLACLQEVLKGLYVGDSGNARWRFLRKSGTRAVSQEQRTE